MISTIRKVYARLTCTVELQALEQAMLDLEALNAQIEARAASPLLNPALGNDTSRGMLDA